MTALLNLPYEVNALLQLHHLQATLVHTLAETNAAVVFSERARMELDTAIGYLPAMSNILQAPSIHVIPHGAATTMVFPNKEEKKLLLGLRGKTVLLTLGYQGPDKVRRLPVIVKM